MQSKRKKAASAAPSWGQSPLPPPNNVSIEGQVNEWIDKIREDFKNTAIKNNEWERFKYLEQIWEQEKKERTT